MWLLLSNFYDEHNIQYKTSYENLKNSFKAKNKQKLFNNIFFNNNI